MHRTAASLARYALEQLGIRHTFGIPGVHNTELYDEFGASESITPVLVGDGAAAMELSDRLFREGVLAMGIAFPTVPRGKARVRTIVTATHTRDELQFALDTFARIGRELGNARILNLPGEAFVEFQLAAKAERPDLFVAVAAYGDYGPWYICPAKAYEQGGYEAGPASNVSPRAERGLMSAIKRVLREKP